ncbi:MAG TPA: hypothetical protein VFR47_25635 [Anaerolineales bacterium]|nr:hypothetical protein [Anaerolineales bacterium]
MLRFLMGLFVILHGLVHLWYFTLSRGLVEFKPEMGWTGRSWLFTNLLGDSTTRALASVLYTLATVGLVVSGAGIFLRADWWRTVLVGSAIFSSAIILLLWDGGMQWIVQKGLIGFLISVVILIALLLLKQPAVTF